MNDLINSGGGDGPKTEVLVINLASASDRMVFQSEQMKRLGFRATRINAVTKTAVMSDVLEEYSARGIRPFRPVELACLLSHVKCWRHVIESDAPMLIVEDDVVLSDRLPAMIDDLAAAFPDRVVNLETFLDHPKYLGRKPMHAFAKSDFDVFPVIKGSAGAAAYIMPPRVARRLVDAISRRAAIVEIFMGLYGGRRGLQVVPAPAAQMMTLDGFYGGAFGASGASTILTSVEIRERPGQTQRVMRYLRHPQFGLRRLNLELRVAAEKLEGRFLGQKHTIQPCPGLLGRAA